MVITIRDGDGECVEQVFTRTQKYNDIEPIQVAYKSGDSKYELASVSSADLVFGAVPFKKYS